MKLFFFSCATYFLLLGVVSCKDDKIEDPEPPAVPEMRVYVQPMFGNETLLLDSTYTTSEGYGVQFTDLKFYFGNPHNGTFTALDAGLFDYRERGTTLFQVAGNHENYPILDGFLGVASASNHLDPAAFDNNSMLNIANANDMHWGWSVGYIFMKVEAKVDTIQDGNALFDHQVVFHIGRDEYLQNLSFSGLNWTDVGGVHQTGLKLDMQKFLQNGASTIDLKTEHTSHTGAGQEAISAKVITNFAAALAPL